MSTSDVAFGTELASAYATAASGWAGGAGIVYARLAQALVHRLPTVDGELVLDLCAGTGAATAPLLRRGCGVVAVDLAPAMLVVDRDLRPPGVAADAFALPFRPESFSAVVVACGLNHARDPTAFLAESGRVTRSGGVVLTSTFAAGWNHPAKAAVDEALLPYGFRPPAWYERFKQEVEPLTASENALRSLAASVGLRQPKVAREDVEVPATVDQIVGWRFAMASHAGFIAGLSALDRRAAAEAAARNLTQRWQPLVVPLLILSGRV